MHKLRIDQEKIKEPWHYQVYSNQKKNSNKKWTDPVEKSICLCIQFVKLGKLINHNHNTSPMSTYILYYVI